MKLKDNIREILYADDIVRQYNIENEWKSKSGISWIGIVSFLIMSVLNIIEKSYWMLGTTLGSAVLLLLGYIVGRKNKNVSFLSNVFLFVFLIVFSIYTIMGGNDGFAVLWLLLVPYVSMFMIDIKKGFAISFYFLLMLFLCFIGPLKGILIYSYGSTFMLRYPFLYLINFAFAWFLISKTRVYQKNTIDVQKELEYLSVIDTATGVKSRNSYNKFLASFDPKQCCLITVVFIDVNGLHEVNNKYGHDVGDKMLREIANSCKSHFPNDEIFRMGGDEFMIISDKCDKEKALSIMDKISKSISNLGYTISYGVTSEVENINLSEMVKTSDTLMLKSKELFYANTSHKRIR